MALVCRQWAASVSLTLVLVFDKLWKVKMSSQHVLLERWMPLKLPFYIDITEFTYFRAQNRVCVGTSEITPIKMKLIDNSYIII